MNIYAPIILCFVPFVTVFVLCAILVPGLSVAREFLATLAGLASFIPIVILQFLLPTLGLFRAEGIASVFLRAFIFAGIIEETFKAAALLILNVKNEKASHYFLYTILAGMVLACFESVIYFLQTLQTASLVGVSAGASASAGAPTQAAAQTLNDFAPLKLIFLRMITTMVVHSFCAALGGLSIFYSKNIRRNFAPLVWAILLHGSYDFFASWTSSLKYFALAPILLMLLECRIFYTRTTEELRAY